MSGRRWLLLRGLTRESGHWGPFLEHLRAAFPGDTVETPDLPGCGTRVGESAPTTVAATLAAVRTAPADRPPATLLALSLGAMVAHEWLRRHPGELAGAVLINTSTGSLCPPWRRMRPSAALGLLGAALARAGEAREGRVHRLTSARPEGAGLAVAHWTRVATLRPVRRAAALRQLLAAARYRSVPTATAVPTLVLVGGGDRLVDPRCGRTLASALHARLREHPTAGHDLPLDEPSWVVAEVKAWLEVHEGRAM